MEGEQVKEWAEANKGQGTGSLSLIFNGKCSYTCCLNQFANRMNATGAPIIQTILAAMKKFIFMSNIE